MKERDKQTDRQRKEGENRFVCIIDPKQYLVIICQGAISKREREKYRDRGMERDKQADRQRNE